MRPPGIMRGIAGSVQFRHWAVGLHKLLQVTFVTVGLDIDLHRSELGGS